MSGKRSWFDDRLDEIEANPDLIHAYPTMRTHNAYDQPDQGQEPQDPNRQGGNTMYLSPHALGGSYVATDTIYSDEPGDPRYNERQAQFEADTDWQRIEQRLRSEAAARGIAYDPSDLAGIQRNAGYDRSHLGNSGAYSHAIEMALLRQGGIYDQRATNVNAERGEEGPAGLAGFGAGYGQPLSIQPFQGVFQAPDPSKVLDDPSVKFQLERGMDLLQKSAAGKGTLFTTGTGQAIQEYGQGVAAAGYSDLYSRAASEFDRAYGIFRNNETDRFSSQRTNFMDAFNIFDSDRNFQRALNLDERDEIALFTGLGGDPVGTEAPASASTAVSRGAAVPRSSLASIGDSWQNYALRRALAGPDRY